MVEEHYEILQKGRQAWNDWMEGNWRDLPTIEIRSKKPIRQEKKIQIPFTRADLSGIDLTDFKNFSGYNFHNVNFSNSNLTGINFTNSKLRRGNFRNTDLRSTSFTKCDCELANFIQADLSQSSFIETSLKGANFSNASLFKAVFKDSKLWGSSLMWAKMIETTFANSDLSNCRVYGASIWNLTLDNTIQSNIIITKRNEFNISLDNLEVAQFLYLIISNKKIQNVIEALTSKIVLILGRFTPARKQVLDQLKEELTKLNYVPVIFDFQKPSNKDFIEPILIIAQLSKFVIADFSDPKIILEEVPIIARNTSTVIIPILEAGQQVPITLDNLRVNQRSISKIFFYPDIDNLISKQLKNIIKTADKLLAQLNKRKPK